MAIFATQKRRCYRIRNGPRAFPPRKRGFRAAAQARIGRNPKTGDRVEVPAKKIPFFKPSKELKDLVNGEHAGAGAPAPAAPPVM